MQYIYLIKRNKNPLKSIWFCDYCSKEFTIYSRIIHRNKHHFCSRLCQNKKTKQRMLGTKYHLGFKNSEETKRIIGLKSSRRTHSLETRKKMSEIHKRLGSGKWMKGKKASEATKRKLSEIMKAIGKKPPSCKGIHLSEEHKLKISLSHRGSRNYRWKGGISRERHNGYLYNIWTKKVFKRDNWTCQMCGERGKTLNAHHIKPWALFKKLRYTLKNGITLCENCHKTLHKTMVIR